ncbi:tannase/feruloyl esterase family alpha/beta hydrolase [Streptomyces lycii]|uniref:Tannase/feruloyl esterase family alpha/beta hydrolase n=1 Tax=Streptomyces lycii TaxID=2654337 RepID=A0ABQ7FRB1_9ACTN|nr:tannase/feruloyl esterase family alpha/beta hydrolase [Streptomyces lycii]KAF4409883.1 tannase/feruloyl esterase family alpha/beta hydrolase [Streptomyces lycii]
MRPRRRAVPLLATALLMVTVAGGGAPARASAHTPSGAHGGHCARQDRIDVPRAEHQESACLPDLTTAALAGTRYTDTADQTGLAAAGTRRPSGVPGIQIDGYFPDDSRLNTTHGWHHDAQFVIRLPDDWNGGLVVTGAPGTRKQYATDALISDHVLARGYAYASTDKGNSGPDFHTDGGRPGDAIAEWNRRTTELTRAARAAVADRYGQRPLRTYITGISNGGYLTRWQLENRPELYDGGVDWEGTLWTAEGPNLLTSLPTAVAYGTDEASATDMARAGFAPESGFLWPYHQQAYWGVTQKTYRAELDPSYDPHCPGPSAGGTTEEILAPCASDASYVYERRPASVRKAVGRIALTGRIGKPMITLHGDLDALLPLAADSGVYDRMISERGRERLHRFYTVEDGTHVDGLYDRHPDRLRPILPCYRAALSALTAWVERGAAPPADRTLRRPGGGDLVNSCSLRDRG